MYGLVPRFCSINTVMSRPPKYLLPFMCARFETGKWLAIQASYFSVSLELSVTISLGTNDWESHGNNECCLQFSSVAQSCLTLCNPMNCSIPGLPVHHQLPESTQTHVYCVGDAIQPSHPLSSLSPPALNLSQHQGLFKWVRSSHQVAKVLEFQLQHHSIQWTLRTDLL